MLPLLRTGIIIPWSSKWSIILRSKYFQYFQIASSDRFSNLNDTVFISGVFSTTGIHEIKDRVEFVEEAILMADFCHKNVLSLIAIVIEQNVPYVVLPLMEHGDLRNYVSNQRNVSILNNIFL